MLLTLADSLYFSEDSIIYAHYWRSDPILLIGSHSFLYVLVAAESVLVKDEKHVDSVLAACEEIISPLWDF